jgi:putative transposase
MDFMHDNLMNGTSFRTFNVMDDYDREALSVFADFSINAEKVILFRSAFVNGRRSAALSFCIFSQASQRRMVLLSDATALTAM